MRWVCLDTHTLMHKYSNACSSSTPLRKECAWLAEQSGRGALKARCRGGRMMVGWRECGRGGNPWLPDRPLPGLWSASVLADSVLVLILPPSIFFILTLFSLILHRELDHNDISGTIEDTNGAFSGLDSLNKLWVSPLTLSYLIPSSSLLLSARPFHLLSWYSSELTIRETASSFFLSSIISILNPNILSAAK